jgi:hypothetical protein
VRRGVRDFFSGVAAMAYLIHAPRAGDAGEDQTKRANDAGNN